jgi:DNA-binding beta-propeller fold protein YncE
MCFDMHDNLFITSLEQHQVFVYDKHGKSITQRPHVSPYSCVVDSTGRLFVSQRLNNCVTIDGKRGFEVRAPQGLALNHEENLLYVCSYVICVFSTQNFCFAREIGRGVLYAPESVVVLSTGQIAVSALRSIHIFDASGLFVRKIGQDVLPCPCQLAVDAQDNVYVVDRDAQAIYIFTANGCLVNKLLQSEARGIAISSSGLVARSYCRMVELLTCDLPYGVKQYHYGLVKCAGDASPPAG